MRILVIGGGGREHALCWKIAKSPKCGKLFCIPGNAGISEIAETVSIDIEDIDSILKFAASEHVDLTVVGPEASLVKGIVDRFEDVGLRIFGPRKELARLEGSKVFAKELMKRCGVPTASFEVFRSSVEALKYLDKRKAPVVVKADGLASGKGVVVAKHIDEAKDAVKKMMAERIFGASGDTVIIEDCLVGEEASIIVISDGKNFVPLASSQDHKRVYNNDIGPNTGGMGAYSPAPVITDAMLETILDTIIAPVISGLAKEGKPYKGALYAGIMVTDKGPSVLEFNARFGDPETQVLMPRLESDLVDCIEHAIDGRLENYKLEWDERPCVSVVMASGGYPGNYAKGAQIEGLDAVKSMEDITVFHAGTKLGLRATDGKKLFLTSGGRVLNVTALGDSYKDAIDNCYKAVRMIHFEKAHYRMDIGHRVMEKRGDAACQKNRR